MSRYAPFFMSIVVFFLCCIFLLLGVQSSLVIVIMTVALLLVLIGIYDVFSNHNVLRLYPIMGHMRYIFEFIRPEIQQYFVATNTSGRPYNRMIRSLVYQRAKNVSDSIPFGTQYDLINENYHFAQHSINAKEPLESSCFVNIGTKQCLQPYKVSRINISGMSFGALSGHAIMAMNRGAKLSGMVHNTGEGGISPYHLKEGGALTWQLGTAYNGARTDKGEFDEAIFSEKSQLAVVKMIEIKISQGAKPSLGGMVPASKITPEIAAIRGVPLGKDCVSPSVHNTFSTPIEMMCFVQKLRELSKGKPVGFKLCLGRHEEFHAIVKAMLETGILPDFITVDGAEGGTGSAPVEFTNRLGTPGDEGLAYIYNTLVGVNLKSEIHLIASGKIATGFDVVRKIALGADSCNIGRAMMFSVGCIQALSCNTNECPTGVATTNKSRQRAINVYKKAQRVANYHDNTMKSFLEIMGAMGVAHPDDLMADLIHYRCHQGESVTYQELFRYIEPGSLLANKADDYYQKSWNKCTAQSF